MRNILFFSNSNKLLSASYCLTNLSKKFNCIGTCNNSEAKLSTHIINLRPHIVAIGLEQFLTEGLETTQQLSQYYNDVKVVINCDNIECIQKLENTLHTLQDDVLCFVSTEQILRVLLREQKNNFIISPYAYDNIVAYYNLDLQYNQKLALTPTEKKVLTLLSNGNSYKKIAFELSIAFETVKSHIQNIYKKLEVQNSSGAVSKAIKYRLIE